MFMVSVRLSRKRMLVGVLALAVAVSAGIIGAKLVNARDDGGDYEAKPVAENTANVKDEKKSQKKNSKKAAAKTNDQRVEFIESFGWEVETEPVEVMEVIVPKEFDDVYKEYNSIQKLNGFDLESFAGKRIKRYSYAVTNYPGVPENVRINLLVSGNKIIGGDVASLEAGGFMHGFAAE